MKTSYTPGPWTLEQLDCPNSYWQQYEIRSGSLLIGNLDLVTTHSNPSANARLIEQAPKMLELLQDIYAHLFDGGTLHDGSLIFAEDAPAVEVLRATINNAGGELK